MKTASRCPIPELPALVFTDLDGTLLDHQSYDFTPALSALKALAKRNIPVLIVTSKTQAEVLQLREQLPNRHPFIVENGGAIFIPENYFYAAIETPLGAAKNGYRQQLLGTDYPSICAYLAQLRKDLNLSFQGFADLTDAEVAQHTGLPLEQAHQARQRASSEPLLWQDSEQQLETFRQALASRNLRLIRGGRFYHVLGDTDKAQAMAQLRTLFEQQWRQRPHCIALGDAPNDRDMLAAADTAIIVKSDKSPNLELQHKRLIRTQATGPAGWNQSILSLLDGELITTTEQFGRNHLG